MASSASAGGRRASGRPKPKAGGLKGGGALARWWKVALLVLGATIGLPVAHAIFGDVVAMLGAALLLGFLLGRWTAR